MNKDKILKKVAWQICHATFLECPIHNHENDIFRNRRNNFQSKWITQFYGFIISNFNFIRSNQFATNSCIRWWKAININNRSNKKKANETRNRIVYTVSGICFFNYTIYSCYVSRHCKINCLN